ncbi:GNAT family N-acetyltransferase [Kibdelosporangium phytohabitans]|uniref:GNAT family N-acetyltransferase n=1 Tax=Kibdelosporangium phytohabitans TaxID=860235 RepID=UPI0019E79B5F|nr:GNAT family N-acetyltransferase [Kibdelosporangium phytohabitans]MBE1461286.1 GNAT superfamily N-acetyltransferase [Kibdelosporangium phytohabitans]
MIRVAGDGDFAGLMALAAEVEDWFGPMVAEPGFHRAVRTHIGRGTALVAGDVSGGLLFDPAGPTYHVDWLVVSKKARGSGIGRALMADAVRRFVRGPGSIEVVTFGPDHPGAESRVFYERLGYVAGPMTEPGPEGGSRQVFRVDV